MPKKETTAVGSTAPLVSNPSTVRLCPAQKKTFDYLSAGLKAGSILRLWGGVGRGKTTILKELHQQIGGAFLSMKDFVEASARNAWPATWTSAKSRPST